MPSLPVDSAMQLLGPVAEALDAGAVGDQRDLVPAGRAPPRRAPRRAPAPGCPRSPAERARTAPRPGRAARPRRRRPARTAPGRTRSAREYRPPTSGSASTVNAPISRAVASSGEPGSVTMTKCRPASPRSARRRGTPASTRGGGCRSPPWSRTCWTPPRRCAPAGRPAPPGPGAGRWCPARSAAAEGARDDLGGQRRAAHAGEHHVVQVGQLRFSSASWGSSSRLRR